MTPLSPPAAQGTAARPKPMDLPALLRDAFLAGRGLKDGDKLSDADQAAWVAYDPEPMLAYQRLVAFLSASPSPEAFPASGVEKLREAAEFAWFRADDVSERIHSGKYRASLSDVEDLRNQIRKLVNLTRALTAAPAPEDR